MFYRAKLLSRNPDLKFKVIVEKFSEKQVVTMQTSTGDLQTYLRFGRFKFYVNDQLAELTIFSSEDGYFCLLLMH